MKSDKVIKGIIYIFANLVLLVIISIAYGNMMKAADMFRVEKLNFYIILIGLLLFLFGLLIEYEKLQEALKNGFNINKGTFIVAIGMLIISGLPYGFLIHFNISLGLLLNYKVVRYIFSLWSGILVARSLVSK